MVPDSDELARALPVSHAKLSLDWSYSFDQVVALGSGYGYTNWLPSGDNGGEWLLRTQLQLFF